MYKVIRYIISAVILVVDPGEYLVFWFSITVGCSAAEGTRGTKGTKTIVCLIKFRITVLFRDLNIWRYFAELLDLGCFLTTPYTEEKKNVLIHPPSLFSFIPIFFSFSKNDKFA